MNIRESEIWVNFLDIDTNHLSLRSDDLRNHLEKAPWSTRNIENIHPWFYELILLLDFEKLKGTSSTISEFFRFLKVRIMDDKWFCHGCKGKNFDFVGKGATIPYLVHVVKSLATTSKKANLSF